MYFSLAWYVHVKTHFVFVLNQTLTMNTFLSCRVLSRFSTPNTFTYPHRFWNTCTQLSTIQLIQVQRKRKPLKSKGDIIAEYTTPKNGVTILLLFTKVNWFGCFLGVVCSLILTSLLIRYSMIDSAELKYISVKIFSYYRLA